MFTGIIKGVFQVSEVQKLLGMTRYGVNFSSEILQGLIVGASVSIDGVCQTVVKIQDQKVWFDAIQETLKRSTLQFLEEGQWVNVERAAKMGDEIGGHLLSGHVMGKVELIKIEEFENNSVFTLRSDLQWTKYLFSKGYVALDGASLTLVDVDLAGIFTVHLIPETLRMTTFGKKKVGAWINLEIDSMSQAIVETVERLFPLMRDRISINNL